MAFADLVVMLIWGKTTFSGGLEDAESSAFICSRQINVDRMQMFRDGVRTERMRGVFS